MNTNRLANDESRQRQTPDQLTSPLYILCSAGGVGILITTS